jgi:hypothetical protein
MSETRIQLLALFVGIAGASTTQGAPPSAPPNHNNTGPNHEHHNGFGGGGFFSAARQFAEHHFEEWKANQKNHIEPNKGPQTFTMPNHEPNKGPQTFTMPNHTEPNPATTNHPTQGAASGTTNPAKHPGMLANIGPASATTSANGSKPSSSSAGTTNHGQNEAVMNSEEHIERAMHHLSEARSAIRAGHDTSAEYEIHEAIKQSEEAIEPHHGHSGNNGSAHTAVASASKPAASSKLTTVSASSSPTSSTHNTNGNVGSQEHPHIHDAVRHLREAERQIKEGHSGRAELDVHDAFVQLTEALRDRRR